MDKTDEYVDRVKHLPTAPVLLGQLRNLLSDPNPDVDRLLELIRYDPALTVEILKRSNSVYFRGAEPVSDIEAAANRVGLSELSKVLSTVTAPHPGTQSPAENGLDPNNLWRHSVVTALAAAKLAEFVQESQALAFTAGLLHDIGKLVLNLVETAVYGAIVQRAGSFGRALLIAEETSLGVSHAEVGARLLARWGLPVPIVLAALHHHESSTLDGPAEGLVPIIRLANALAHHLPEQNSGSPPDLGWACDDPDALMRLRLEPGDLTAAVEQTQFALRRLDRILHAPN